MEPRKLRCVASTTSTWCVSVPVVPRVHVWLDEELEGRLRRFLDGRPRSPFVAQLIEDALGDVPPVRPSGPAIETVRDALAESGSRAAKRDVVPRLK